MIQHLESYLTHIKPKFGKKVREILMEDGLRLDFSPFFFLFLLWVSVCLSSSAVGLWKEPKHFKGKIKFLVKHWGCVCNQLNLFSFVAALAFSQQPWSLFPMGSITFAFCFNFPWTDFFWQGDPCWLLMKLCLSLLLFKHIFVFKLFLLVRPGQFVRVTLLFGW